MEENNTEKGSVKYITILAETGDVNKQICRLCLEVIPSEDCEAIEETEKEQLEALLININFDISDNAVACNKCVEKLQECLDFKSTCFCVDNDVSFVNVDGKVDIKPAFKEELSGTSICRLCMLTIEDESLNCTFDSKDMVFLRGVIKNCIPQIDLDTVHESLICNRCLSNIKKYNNFKKTCLEVEQRIQHYRQVVAGYGEVVLKDVLKFKYYDTLSQPVIIKKECSDVEYGDVNGMICPKNENIASIKCEEIDIKDELDSRVEASEFLQSTNCTSSMDNGSSKKDEHIRTLTPNEARQPAYSCPKCPYSSNRRYRIKVHKCHTEHKVHKCFICPFVNNSKFLLSTHMASHKGPTKAFACPECSFETHHKGNLRKHLFKHKDKSEVEMYKCDKCIFSTRHKKSIVRHQLVHKNPEEISMYKCAKCGFETKHKKNLTWHKLTHEDPTVVNKFKCDKCTYRSKKLSDVKRHMRIHVDQHQYRCAQCTYSSKNEHFLIKHKRMHKMDVASSEYKAKFLCDECDFRTKYKKYLSIHKYLHDPTKSTFKCSQCEYSTWRKARFLMHQRQHMELEKTETFCCATCGFKTKYKGNLKHHIMICLEKQREKDGSKKNMGKIS